MLDIGLLLTVIGVLFEVSVLRVVGLALVAFAALRWRIGAARSVRGRFPAPRSLTTVSH